MKYCFLVILGIIFFSCNNEKNNSAVSDSKSTELSQNITIIVKNPLQKEIFFDWSSLLDAATQPYEATSAHDTIFIKSNIPVKLNSSDMIRSGKNIQVVQHTFLLYPNDTVFLEKPQSITSISGKSEQRSKELSFFPQFREQFGNYEGWYVPTPFRDDKPAVRLQKIKEAYQNRIAFANQFFKVNHSSASFKDFISKEFYYKQYSDFLALYQENLLKNKAIVKDAQVARFLADFKIDDSASEIPIYGYSVLLLESLLQSDKSEIDFYQNLKTKYSGKTRDIILYRFVDFCILNTSKHISTLYTYFQKDAENIVLKNNLKEQYQFMANTLNSSGNKSLDSSTVIHFSDKKTLTWKQFLEKNAGKITYLDFWASWCKPCIEEMKYSHEVQKKYPNINFIYLSQDENYKHWENSILARNMSKESHYLIGSSKNSAILSQFNITSIPRYMIIDQYGKVLNADAPRPSDAKLKTVFDELLKEK
ncbi:TlpA disulfide reductase family protein [Cellulophaga sp. BC115SP]|uniref:TlpA family protein disulfide reductase n=1 Tax=Cellulophaga sp. BC115SP TaxID=2683263 RepID=UPI0014133421|nr:TlpA disulfide reductase family protein [Cellulophaga sp. BC115SP]NBB28222.1 redoxin family protein [Cellulophaga sp. BC115SP]